MDDLGFRPFDCDNHYYEATDAFTRHLDPRFRKRALQWAEIDGKQRLLAGGRVFRFVPHPTFERVSRPGVLDDYFRGRAGTDDIREAIGDLEPVRPEYRDRDARLALMDRQGLEACLLFPTLGVGVEEALKHDPPACAAAFDAFDRWLDEDWGFAHQERIFAVPYITLVDVDAAIETLEWVLERGARAVCLRAGPVATATGSTSPGDRRFDPFWARVDAAGITVAIHSGDSGYGRYAADWEPFTEMEAYRQGAFRDLYLSDRPVTDTVAAYLCHGVFRRFPNIRLACVETGSAWVPELFRKLTKTFAQNPGAYDHQDPVEELRRHVWVSPYFEDDIPDLVERIGADHVLFGSDYPHPEGLAEPVSYVHDLEGLSDDQIRHVMRENAWGLVQPRVPAAA